MKSDLSQKITELLKATDALAGEYEADPFGAEVIEAHGSITAAQALLAEASNEPDSLSPDEIVAMRQDGSDALEAAKIAHRRAEARRSQYYELMHEKLSELKSDALPVIQETRRVFESKIEAAVIDLSGGYFSEHQNGFTIPKVIANHRSRALKRHETAVDGRNFASVSGEQELSRIRAALEACLQHLA